MLFSHQGSGGRSSRNLEAHGNGRKDNVSKGLQMEESERDIDSRPEAAGVDALGLDK